MLLEKSGHARAECGSTEVGNGQFTGSAPMKPTCGCAAQETANVAQSYAEVAQHGELLIRQQLASESDRDNGFASGNA